MTKTPQISVVIGTFNQAAKLNLVLNGFARQTLAKDAFEVLVADSCSTDDTRTICEAFKADMALTYLCIQNQGKAKARNLAAQQASGAVLFLTDADMVPAPDLLEEHLKAHGRLSTLAMFEGLTFNLKTETLPADQAIKSPYITRYLRSGQRLGFYYFLSGNLSLPRDVFLQHGGFDERFTGYGWEDIELGYRLVRLGRVPLCYLPEAVNYHYHVLADEEEIHRAVAKGVAALTVLKLHPELRSFLGLDPWLLRFWQWLDRPVWEQKAWKQFREGGALARRLVKWCLMEIYYRRGARQGMKAEVRR